MNGNKNEGSVRIAMILGFLLACFAVGLQACDSEGSGNSKTFGYRLPDALSPELYKLDILTNLADMNDNFTFHGKVCILVKCNTETNLIILHAKNLKIHEPEVTVTPIPAEISGNGEEKGNEGLCRNKCQGSNTTHLNIVNHCYHSEYQLYIMQLSEKLQPGSKYMIYIPYDGEILPDLVGFYRSSYKDKQTGEEKWLGVTQFESTDARKAFPCFDEPIFKSRFQLNIGRINTKSSISNMRKICTIPIQGMANWEWDQYETTLPMSTYLLAFVVSEFAFKESTDSSNNVTFRVWARKDAIDQVDFALDVGPKVLKYFEEYYKIGYPLPKQDMVGVPDFSSGAMENWGLITYRETALLFDPKVSPRSFQQYIASVIAHELAHQWFGNLVTMKWWTDLWLNEGFATYVATQGIHFLQPEWNSAVEDAFDNIISVFTLDSLKSSHPISIPIGDPSEIAQIFDTISYRKGACVIRMMNLFLGEETFRDGVSNYLRKHAYGNAEQDDLWKSLSEAAHKNKALPEDMNVKDIMDTWTVQTGYPIITVTRDYENGTATVSQKRYLADNAGSDQESDNTTWWVPVSYTTESNPNFSETKPRYWISKGTKEIVINDLKPEEWIILNINLSGLYRVNYDYENWYKLINTMKTDHKKIGLLNRMQLVHDSFSLAETGYIDYNISMSLIDYVAMEEDYLAWDGVLNEIGFLDKLLRCSPSYDLFRKYVKTLIKPAYERIEPVKIDDKPESLQKLTHQKKLRTWACKLGVGDCRSKAISSFGKWMSEQDPDKNNPIDVNSRSRVYCTAIKFGGEEEWEFLWERYQNSNVGTESKTILSSLACTREMWLLNRYLQWSFTKIRRQDTNSVFAYIARSDFGFYLAKSFLKDNIEKIYEAFESKAVKMGSFVSDIAHQIRTRSELDELKDFVEKNKKYFKQAEKSVSQSLEAAKVAVFWHENYSEDVIKILESKTKQE